jgi:hypothetical protein
VYVCMYVCIYVRIYVCVYVVYIYAYTYVCVCTYVRSMYVCRQYVSTYMFIPAPTENADSGQNFITQHVKWLPFLGLNLT